MQFGQIGVTSGFGQQVTSGSSTDIIAEIDRSSLQHSFEVIRAVFAAESDEDTRDTHQRSNINAIHVATVAFPHLQCT